MAIKPSHRAKKRYIVYEIISEGKFRFDDVKNSILKSFSKYLGEMGIAKANPFIIENTFLNNKGIIRCAHNCVDDIKATLALTKEISNERVIINSIGVSGIIKKAKSKFLAI